MTTEPAGPTKKLFCFDMDQTITTLDISGGLLRRHNNEIGRLEPGETLTREAIEAQLKARWPSKFANKDEFIRNKPALLKTLQELLAVEHAQVVITSSTRYPQLVPLILEYVGLTPDEIGKIRVFYSKNSLKEMPELKAEIRESTGFWGSIFVSKESRHNAAQDAKKAKVVQNKCSVIEEAAHETGFTDRKQVCVIDDDQDSINAAKSAGFTIIPATKTGESEDIGYLQTARRHAGLEALGAEYIPQRKPDATLFMMARRQESPENNR